MLGFYFVRIRSDPMLIFLSGNRPLVLRKKTPDRNYDSRFSSNNNCAQLYNVVLQQNYRSGTSEHWPWSILGNPYSTRLRFLAANQQNKNFARSLAINNIIKIFAVIPRYSIYACNQLFREQRMAIAAQLNLAINDYMLLKNPLKNHSLKFKIIIHYSSDLQLLSTPTLVMQTGEPKVPWKPPVSWGWVKREGWEALHCRWCIIV